MKSTVRSSDVDVNIRGSLAWQGFCCYIVPEKKEDYGGPTFVRGYEFDKISTVLYNMCCHGSLLLHLGV